MIIDHFYSNWYENAKKINLVNENTNGINLPEDVYALIKMINGERNEVKFKKLKTYKWLEDQLKELISPFQGEGFFLRTNTHSFEYAEDEYNQLLNVEDILSTLAGEENILHDAFFVKEQSKTPFWIGVEKHKIWTTKYHCILYNNYPCLIREENDYLYDSLDKSDIKNLKEIKDTFANIAEKKLLLTELESYQIDLKFISYTGKYLIDSISIPNYNDHNLSEDYLTELSRENKTVTLKSETKIVKSIITLE